MRPEYHVRDSLVNTNVRAWVGISDPMEQDALRHRLVKAREARGLTQGQLAAMAKVSQGTIGNIEAGIRDGAASLAAIAHALGVSYWWLRDGDGEMELPLRQPDSEAIADAFEALPTDSAQAQDRRQWLYRSIMVQIDEARRAASASAPAPAPAVLPIVSPRRKK